MIIEDGFDYFGGCLRGVTSEPGPEENSSLSKIS